MGIRYLPPAAPTTPTLADLAPLAEVEFDRIPELLGEIERLRDRAFGPTSCEGVVLGLSGLSPPARPYAGVSGMQKRRSAQLELACTARMRWEDVTAALREQVRERLRGLLRQAAGAGSNDGEGDGAHE